jgi:hypothetical protein
MGLFEGRHFPVQTKLKSLREVPPAGRLMPHAHAHAHAHAHSTIHHHRSPGSRSDSSSSLAARLRQPSQRPSRVSSELP